MEMKERTLRGKHQELKEAYALSQGKSVRLAAVELDISRSFIQQKLRKDTKAFPYKFQIVLKLEEEDNDRRVEMNEMLLNHYNDDPSILDNIWFSNEAVFHLSGRANRRNTQISETKILKLCWRKSVIYLSLWCAISAEGIIG